MADNDKSTKSVEKAQPVWKGSQSSDEPLEAPDGHVTLTQEDIDERDGS